MDIDISYRNRDRGGRGRGRGRGTYMFGTSFESFCLPALLLGGAVRARDGSRDLPMSAIFGFVLQFTATGVSVVELGCWVGLTTTGIGVGTGSLSSGGAGQSFA